MKQQITIGLGMLANFLAVKIARGDVLAPADLPPRDRPAPADDPVFDTTDPPPSGGGGPTIELGRYIRSQFDNGPERCFDTLTGEFVDMIFCDDLSLGGVGGLDGELELGSLEVLAPAGSGSLPLSASLSNTGIAGALGDDLSIANDLNSCCGG